MSRFAPLLMLLGCGMGWGLTVPLLRISVSTGHPPLGLLLWQKLIMLAVMLPLLGLARQPLPPVRGRIDLFVAIALFGAVLPGYFSYLTAAHLPGGVRAIIIALVPMFVLPMALLIGYERPDPRRTLGVLLGAAAMVLIALPGAGVTPSVGVGIILLALVAPFSYGVEANYLAWRTSLGLHPFQVMFGAAAAGLVLVLPLAVATGQLVPLAWPLGPAEWALVVSSILNALAYAGYVWLVGQAGSLFASLMAYLVTGFGVVWSMLLLGERYSLLVWAAFAILVAGIALVQPRPAAPVEP